MTWLLILFLGTATLLWLSVFGYLLALRIIVYCLPQTDRNVYTCPEIAVVIPTLNDEELILAKLADLKRTDYPHDKITMVVVDGGSVDQTTEVTRQQILQGNALQLMCLNTSRGRSDQINHALGRLPQEIIVVTNVDAVLEPSCIKELVSMLENDLKAGVVGATIWSADALVEERLHSYYLNYLWWLEGEVLSSAGVSGVCYAFRREAVLPLAPDALADDIYVTLAAGAKGYRARICRTAHAKEIRVPRTASEFMQFRYRRGSAYLYELWRSSQYANVPVGWWLVRLMRLWHFLVTPKLGVGLVFLALLLMMTPHWRWPLMALVAFAAPALTVMVPSNLPAGDWPPRWSLARSTSRWFVLTWVSLLTLKPHPSASTPYEWMV